MMSVAGDTADVRGVGLIGQLVAKSLVSAEAADGAVRYRLATGLSTCKPPLDTTAVDHVGGD